MQQASVGKMGEGIVKSKVPDFLLRSLARRYVGLGADIVGYTPLIILDCRDGQPFWIHFAILAAVPNFALPSAGNPP